MTDDNDDPRQSLPSVFCAAQRTMWSEDSFCCCSPTVSGRGPLVACRRRAAAALRRRLRCRAVSSGSCSSRSSCIYNCCSSPNSHNSLISSSYNSRSCNPKQSTCCSKHGSTWNTTSDSAAKSVSHEQRCWNGWCDNPQRPNHCDRNGNDQRSQRRIWPHYQHRSGSYDSVRQFRPRKWAKSCQRPLNNVSVNLTVNLIRWNQWKSFIEIKLPMTFYVDLLHQYLPSPKCSNWQHRQLLTSLMILGFINLNF